MSNNNVPAIAAHIVLEALDLVELEGVAGGCRRCGFMLSASISIAAPPLPPLPPIETSSISTSISIG